MRTETEKTQLDTPIFHIISNPIHLQCQKKIQDYFSFSQMKLIIKQGKKRSNLYYYESSKKRELNVGTNLRLRESQSKPSFPHSVTIGWLVFDYHLMRKTMSIDMVRAVNSSCL